MNLLVVGSGKGSWEIRGRQLGAALGARVTSQPTEADWDWADMTVLVKRAGFAFAEEAHAADVPIVWDVLDVWQQPAENGISEQQARRLMARYLAQVRPTLAIGATEAQAEACGGVYLPHHAWDHLTPTSARPEMAVIGYEGNPLYLGAWRSVLERVCSARGWRLVINPTDLRAVDVFVALRDGPWDGWICRQWKSGVKHVNALAAGRPVIAQQSAAANEIPGPGSQIETRAELIEALDWWADADRRAVVADVARQQAPDYQLDRIAARYAAIVGQVRTSCAA